ncbi:hypothetical protein [Streptomyces sp. NPDC057702]|uniref:hypothetical protein n=1 Tax=Streptomyces sp. NPDC057702 TaxID=3346221 RepID=UPI0036AE5A88
MRPRLRHLSHHLTAHALLTTALAVSGAAHVAVLLDPYGLPPLLNALLVVAVFASTASGIEAILRTVATRTYRCPDCLVSATVVYGTPVDHQVYQAMVADHPHHRTHHADLH